VRVDKRVSAVGAAEVPGLVCLHSSCSHVWGRRTVRLVRLAPKVVGVYAILLYAASNRSAIKPICINHSLITQKSVLLLFPTIVNQFRNFIFPDTVAVTWPPEATYVTEASWEFIKHSSSASQCSSNWSCVV